MPEKPRYIDALVLREEAELFGKEIILGMMEAFIKGYKDQLEKVATDIQTGNFTELEKSSHKLAGSVCCFYAETLFKAARDIEQHARNRDLCEARKAFAEIAASMESFVSELTILKKELEE